MELLERPEGTFYICMGYISHASIKPITIWQCSFINFMKLKLALPLFLKEEKRKKARGRRQLSSSFRHMQLLVRTQNKNDEQ